MHARRKQRRWPRVILAVALIFVILAGGCATFLYFHVPTADRGVPSATAPDGVVKGLAVHFGDTGDALVSPVTHAELTAEAQRMVTQAKTYHMNTLFLYVKDGDTLLYRDRYLPALANLNEHNNLFSRLDGLSAFCSAANEQGLAVCAVLERADVEAGGDELRASLARMFQKYPLLAVYVRENDGEDALFDRYTALLGTAPELTGITQASWADPSALFLRTVADNQESQTFSGVVFDLKRASQFEGNLSLMLSALDEGAPPALLDYSPNPTLSVSYPAANATIYTATCFIMGTSDPAQELLLDGTPVQRTGSAGVFGTLVNVAEGENNFTFTQGGQSVPLAITRPVQQSSGTSGGSAQLPHDATIEVEPGTAVQITGWISSLLYDPTNDGNINETVRRGAVATVKSCVETVRNGKITWAYQLSSGDYVLAYNTKILGLAVPRASLTGAAAQQTNSGERLTFSGSGTPLAYTNIVDSTLVLHFYDADAAPDFSVTGSTMIKSISSQALPDGAGTEIILSFDAPLWGYSIEYTDSQMQLLLKRTPVRSQDPSKPLSGTTVLLDPGHGADDTGAMGAAGNTAPTEKDVNLAVSLAAKYRLEQLGATVEMIRSDDTFLTLEERNAQISALQPDFFIAVHHNSLELTVDANSASGTECYYFYDSGKALATSLVDNITAATARSSRGALWGYYYVARNTTCPAVLLEVGFMVNPAEYESIVEDATLWATGDAIARSILSCVPAS